MRVRSVSIIVALGLAASEAPAFAAPLSGGASGGGAIEGGSGAPGSGVGVPGAIVGNMTAAPIGEDLTYAPVPSMRRFKALAHSPMVDVGQPRTATKHRAARQSAF